MRCDGASGGVGQSRINKQMASSDLGVLGVLDSWEAVPPCECALPEGGSPRVRKAGPRVVCSDLDEVHRLLF